MMRIITGKAKGVRLKTLEGDATRPTSERVKEAVFSMLTGDIEDRAVLDLFAGSGQLGLEALSRGAAHAFLVDSSPDAIRIITENAQKTKLAPDCTIVKDGYLAFLRKNAGKKFDLVFLDPPYASEYYKTALVSLYEYDMLKSSSVIVCESDRDIDLEDWGIGNIYSVIKRSAYGKAHITLIERRADK